MKKHYTLASIIAASLFLSSCGLGTSQSAASAGSALGQVAGNSLGNAASTGANILGNVLSNLLGTKTSQQSIQGTWTYSAPKVVFESESILAKIGSSVASSKIENTLSSQLKKIGFTGGKSKITFNSDGTCIMALSNKTYNGTYTFDSNTSKLTITGTLGVANLTCTATVNGNELYMLFDADKLLNVASAVSGVSSSLSTLTSLLNNYNGLKLGWAMTK